MGETDPHITRRKDTSGLKVDPTARGRSERGDPRERCCAHRGCCRPCLRCRRSWIAVAVRCLGARARVVTPERAAV